MKRILSLLVALILIFSVCGCAKSSGEQNIIILFTNDVHCGIDGDIGYSGLVAYKNEVLKQTEYVTLVDCGDSIQGEVIGTISKGEYIVDMMNEVGYQLGVLGNHEFDYGMTQLQSLMKRAEYKYLGCNLTYSGDGENKLSAVEPYEIIEYGDTSVGFIGVSTPESLTSSTPTYFMENDEFVYGFTVGNKGKDLYNNVQSYVDECREKGADYVIILSHLGDLEELSPYNSIDLVNNTNGIDAVLDGHAHNVIPSMVETNKDGESVLISSTGTKLANIGQLIITPSGFISTGLISSYTKKDEATTDYISDITEAYNAEMLKVVATSDIALSCNSSDGVRLVRTRETTIGNLCADAYRYVTKADIALVNGGGIRADIPKGDITYEDIISVHPFGNTMCMVEATGQEILDSLEIASCDTKAEYAENGMAVGENGSFQHVSGLKYTIDTSVEAGVIFDENGMFKEFTGDRRIKDVYVLNDSGEYEPLDPEATYKVASHNYLIKDSGGGITQFSDNALLIDQGMSDYQVLITYITEELYGKLGDKYSGTEGRITVK